jgi:hypothetical protein
MTDDTRSKRPLADFQLHRRCTDHRRCQLVGERHILELISLGAPLPGILNKLCMMIDVRIGNVVSIVSLPEASENHDCSMTRTALQVGLEVFSSCAILSPDNSFLGTLEIYGCDPRRPTLLEFHLINRVTQLASLALQRSNPDDDLRQPPSAKSRSRLPAPIEKPPFIN